MYPRSTSLPAVIGAVATATTVLAAPAAPGHRGAAALGVSRPPDPHAPRRQGRACPDPHLRAWRSRRCNCVVPMVVPAVDMTIMPALVWMPIAPLASDVGRTEGVHHHRAVRREARALSRPGRPTSPCRTSCPRRARALGGTAAWSNCAAGGAGRFVVAPAGAGATWSLYETGDGAAGCGSFCADRARRAACTRPACCACGPSRPSGPVCSRGIYLRRLGPPGRRALIERARASARAFTPRVRARALSAG